MKTMKMKNIKKYKDLPVSEVWKIYMKERKKNSNLTFQDFLEEELEPKFKVGDLIQMDHNHPKAKQYEWLHDIVFQVIKIEHEEEYAFNCTYILKFLTPHSEEKFDIGSKICFNSEFVEEVCHLY